MQTNSLFILLESIDSTNNYAMQQLNAQLAKHGMAYATLEQTAGKGQRGKQWLSKKNMNIAMTILFEMDKKPVPKPFSFSAMMALAVANFLTTYTTNIKIKWPNDIYWNDRKAGGILIENKYIGNQWKWAVVGIGVNINQTDFDDSLINPVSLKQMTNVEYDIVTLSKQLHQFILDEYKKLITLNDDVIITKYNEILYKKNESVKLKKDAATFETTIKEVTANGSLITIGVIERSFEFGEVQWIL